MAPKIGAAYIRVSSDDQLEYSPESQLKVIREYARREGYVIPEEYVYREEDGISGKTASKRPAFRLMIATAKETEPPFDSIFVWKFSRFARNQEEAIMYKNLLKKKGISVRSVSEPSSDSPFSSLIERIIEWMDEYYLINLAGEVRRGMTEKATRGEVMGTAPFGYRAVDKVLVPDENAETVRYIFRSYAEGKGCRALAEELGARGVRTRRGNPPDNRWIQYILQNPAYIGKTRWSTEGHANYSRHNYTSENVMVVDGKHEPIIDAETWETVQARMKQSAREIKYQRKGSEVFMLKGLVRCGDCGATLVHASAASRSLQCYRYAKGQCSVSHSVTMQALNSAVIHSLEEIQKTRSFVFQPQAPRKAAPRRDWEKLITSEENRLLRARNALLDGALTSEEYKEIKSEISDSIAKLRAAQEQEAAAPASQDPDPTIYARRVADVLEILKSPDATEEAKNLALRSILEKIVLHKPGNTLDFYFIP